MILLVSASMRHNNREDQVYYTLSTFAQTGEHLSTAGLQALTLRLRLPFQVDLTLYWPEQV